MSLVMLSWLMLGCRIEIGAPDAVIATTGGPAGEVWIYTSMYQSPQNRPRRSNQPLCPGRIAEGMILPR